MYGFTSLANYLTLAWLQLIQRFYKALFVPSQEPNESK